MLIWLLFYLACSAVDAWIVLGNGAKRIEGWLAFFTVGWFALDWKPEQIRFYVLIQWLILTLVFIYGLFHPQLRQEYFW